jgi:hypothetical protein
MKTHKGKEMLHKSGEMKYKMYSKWDVGKTLINDSKRSQIASQ